MPNSSRWEHAFAASLFHTRVMGGMLLTGCSLAISVANNNHRMHLFCLHVLKEGGASLWLDGGRQGLDGPQMAGSVSSTYQKCSQHAKTIFGVSKQSCHARKKTSGSQCRARISFENNNRKHMKTQTSWTKTTAVAQLSVAHPRQRTQIFTAFGMPPATSSSPHWQAA